MNARRTPLLAWVVLGVAGIYFIGPVLAAFWFTIHNARGFSTHAYTGFLSADGFASSFSTSLLLAVVAVVISIVLMVPTMVLLHVRLPKARPLVEIVSLIPLVVPPVALVVGVRDVISWSNSGSVANTPISSFVNSLQGNPPWLLALVYVVMAMPFTFRAIDAGVQGSGLATLVEASRNLGASWTQTVRWVIVPALLTSILNAALLAFALVLGEYTIAKILSFQTFPVWLSQFGSNDGQMQVALSLLSLLVTWFLLLLIAFAGRRRSRTLTKAHS